MKSKDKLLLHSNMTIGHKNSFKGPLRKGTTSVSLKRTLSNARRVASNEKAKLNRGALSSILTIVGYSSIWDQLLLLFGCLMALANGLGWPLLNFLIASFSNELSVLLIKEEIMKSLPPELSCYLNESLSNSSMISANQSTYFFNLTQQYCDGNGNFKEEYRIPEKHEWVQHIWGFTFPALGTGFLVLVTGYLYVFILNTVSERIVLRTRKLYLKSILRQNMAWLDTRTQGELTSSIMRSLTLIQTALGEKLGLLLFCASEVTISLVFCFWGGWKLTLVLSCLYPILIVIGRISTQVQHKMNKVIRVLNGELAGLIQEVLSAIRTVMAFSGEEKEFRRYLHRLRMSRETNIKQTIIAGMNHSFIFLITQCFISLGFWYGLKLMQYTEKGWEDYTARDVIMINTLVLMSGVFIRLGVPLLDLVVNGFSAAVDIVNVIQRTPEIDSYCEHGITLQQLQGSIEFCNVHFWYPTSVGEKKILKGLNLKIGMGETVALVGPSGGGKSTILHLIQRFYDPQKGKIKIDDKNLQEFNIGWFRRKIGIVSQEPALFNTTIRENIRFGNEDATNEEIIRAAKEANAHEFIMKLPQQYDTVVGEHGGQMSGGERQRIAIARALVRDPSILLLDEATSALDNESEVIVQESLDKARSGRTTIVIAHRLSTIRKSDRIVAVKGGKVVEQGSHEELLNKSNGVYRQLLSQLSEQGNKTDSTDEDEASFTDEESEEEEQHTEDEDDDDSDIDYPEYDTFDLESDKEERSEIKQSFWKILQYSKDDWGYVLGGLVFAVICGCYHSGRCLVFSSITNIVVLKDFHNPTKTILFPCLYVVVGFIAFIAFSLKSWSYSRSQENLLFRVRQKTFDSILHQEIGWFDDPKHGVTNLVSLLTVEAENIKYIPGTMLGTWTYTTVASIFLVTISIYCNWKLALATSSLALFNFINQYIHARITRGGLLALQSTEEKANNLAVEGIRSIRTVISLHIEDIICRRYDAALGNPRSFLDRQIQLRSIISALSDGLMHFGFTIALSYGAYLMYIGEASYFDYNVVISMLIINLMEVAQVLASCPERSKSSIAAYKLLRAIKRKPLIDSNPAAGLRLPQNIETKIAFRDVRFAYPSRPQEEILQGLNIVIEEGQTVAFVGKSGCGKSTSFQLLQRMYDPTSGSVAISGYDLRCVNMPSLRALIGIVSQEPTLFNRTIRENIEYGDNSRDVCMHEVIDAAKQANIHEFIISLRQGYETRIGPRGVQLSGGQKQRVAIARALIKNPRILLLDEATSALDNESERIVQEALEKAREGRTCLVIAHRLSTVQNADQIAVFDRGQIVEKGNPLELLEKKGLYYEFVQIHAGKLRRFSRPLV